MHVVGVPTSIRVYENKSTLRLGGTIILGSAWRAVKGQVYLYMKTKHVKATRIGRNYCFGEYMESRQRTT